MTAECLSPETLFDFFANRAVELECKVMLASLETASAISFADYVRVFVWTCAFEALVYLPLLGLKKVSFARSLTIVLLANLATHPLVTYVFPVIFERGGFTTATAVLAKEIFAPVVETIIVRKLSHLSWSQSAVVAVIANFISWWAGAALGGRLF